MRGERGMSDVVETTSDEDGGAQGLEGRKEGAQRGSEGGVKGCEGARGCKGAIILLFRRGRTPRWR